MTGDDSAYGVLDRAQVEAPGVLQMVHQPPRRAHDHVRLACQRDGLRHHVHAAHHTGAVQTDGGAECREVLADLVRELARRRQHESEEPLRRAQQRVEDGHGERARLAAARLACCVAIVLGGWADKVLPFAKRGGGA